ISYSAEQGDIFSASATLGGLLSSNDNAVRLLLTRVRVGSPEFDNANYIASDYHAGVRYDSDRLPMEEDYGVLRNRLWLSTDRAYKTAIDAIARKRAALENVNVTEKMPDYTAAPPLTLLQPIVRHAVDEEAWKSRMRRVSSEFLSFPDILASEATVQIIQTMSYLASTEGAMIRRPDNLAFVRVSAVAQAPDGMLMHDAITLHAFEASALPPEADMARSAQTVAREVSALAKAPVGDTWSGPVLFEPIAAAQLFGQLLGGNLKLVRKPVLQPGQTVPWLGSELEGRIGSRILPEWMDVVDDATQADYRGAALLGHYEVDDEGVRPRPTVLVEKGVLRGFLLTRTPPRPDLTAGSNGHARFPGPFGQELPGMGNLFVRATKTVPLDDLKKQLLDLCKQRGKPWGIIVRKLDYPSSGGAAEVRQITAENMRSGGGGRPPVPPILVYRIYPDGHEELIRGVHFRELDIRSLRDIVAASDDSYVFNYLDAPVTFALMDASGFVAPTSVVAPAVLFDELELEPAREQTPRVPLVPPPPLQPAG
ncbi:MAG TPA: metallopeptidase TldD-related protein, partial [Bryobacteraceae bacterium]|nr:metallopeptidase TldD-related protein [Bryobacteraceae bacterium]